MFLKFSSVCQGHCLLFLEHGALQRGLSSFRPRKLTNQVAEFQSTMFNKVQMTLKDYTCCETTASSFGAFLTFFSCNMLRYVGISDKIGSCELFFDRL